MKKLLLFLALSLCAAAQDLAVLAGVHITGDPAKHKTLRIENHIGRDTGSARGIIAVTVWMQMENGQGPVYHSYIGDAQTVIAEGQSYPVVTRVLLGTEEPTVKAVLVNVVFDDGLFLGRDMGNDFNGYVEHFAKTRPNLKLHK